MIQKWKLRLRQGATFRTVITVNNLADLTLNPIWRVAIGRPDGVTLVTATTTNGMIAAGASASQKILTIPAATTAAMDEGVYFFDFDIEWTGASARVERIYSLGECIVDAKVPT